MQYVPQETFYWYGCIRRMAAIVMDRSLGHVTSCLIFTRCAPVSGSPTVVHFPHPQQSQKKSDQ